MRQYQDILRRILDCGVEKKPVRMIDGKAIPVDGGVSTLYIPNVFFSHDMSGGFPLLTIRPMPWKSIRVELNGFIQGITSKNWYIEKGCHYWDSWANPKVLVEEKLKRLGTLNCTLEEEKNIKKEIDDLGPIYGYQWRRFNQSYDEDDSGCMEKYDQLQDIVDTLHTNYNDRRMVCSAWNPCQRSRMGLEPCHIVFNVSCGDGKLNLCWLQRSNDFLRGNPSNIASYALLLLLLAKEANLEPGNLSACFVDCHLYKDQIEAAEELLDRKPLTLSSVTIPDILKSGKSYSIFDWTYEDVIIKDRNIDARPLKNMGTLVI